MATSKMLIVSAVALSAVSVFCGVVADSKADAIAYAQNASTTLSVVDLPRNVSLTNLPECKRLNTDTCGTTLTSVWSFPTCCPTYTNFSSNSSLVAADCSFLDLPYSASSWKCGAGNVKSCCKAILCLPIAAPRNSSATASSCPRRYPESLCCPRASSPDFSIDDCQLVANGTTATCQDLGPSYTKLQCCPTGTAAVFTASGAEFASALISQSDTATAGTPAPSPSPATSATG